MNWEGFISVTDEDNGLFFPSTPHHAVRVDWTNLWHKWIPGIFLGGKARAVRKADNLTAVSRLCRKYGKFYIL
jgi:hypothetical protein